MIADERHTPGAQCGGGLHIGRLTRTRRHAGFIGLVPAGSRVIGEDPILDTNLDTSGAELAETGHYGLARGRANIPDFPDT